MSSQTLVQGKISARITLLIPLLTLVQTGLHICPVSEDAAIAAAAAKTATTTAATRIATIADTTAATIITPTTTTTVATTAATTNAATFNIVYVSPTLQS